MIYINDLPTSTDFFNFTLFAVDCTLTHVFNKSYLDLAHFDINNQLSHIYNWLVSNKIVVNENKSRYMILSYSNKLSFRNDILIGNKTIENVQTVNFLGIHIDCNLKFNNHVDHIASKISKSLGIMYKVKFLFPTNILILLYYCLIQPYFDYCIESWFGTSITNINKLCVLQKKAIRIINNLSFCSHTSNYFKLNSILKLNDYHSLQICSYLFKVLNFNYDPDLLAAINQHSHFHEYSP